MRQCNGRRRRRRHGAAATLRRTPSLDAIPADFLARATRSQVRSDWGSYGYGFQWWVEPDGAYRAVGIFGQSIYVNPAEKLVIVTNSAWAEADAPQPYAVHDAYVDAVRRALR